MKIELAGAVIVDEDKWVLLIHRREQPVQRELPGGKVEVGEDSAAAAIREVREELGIEIHVVRSLGGTTFTQTGKDYDYHWHLAVIADGTPELQEEVHDDFRFIDLRQADIGHIALSPNVLQLASAVHNEVISLS